MNKMKINGTWVRKLLLSILCMYILNPFYFNNIELVNKGLYYAMILIPFFLCVIELIKNGLKMELSLLVYVIMYALVIIMVFLLNSPPNNQFISHLCRYLLGVLGTYIIYVIWNSLYISKKITCYVEEIYILACIVYVISTLIMILLPSIKNFWLSIIVEYGDGNLLDKNIYATRVGMAGFSGFGVSFEICCALFFVIYLSLNCLLSKKKVIMYYSFLLMGSAFYGRSGLVVFIIESLLWWGYLLICKGKIKILIVVSMVLIISSVSINYLVMYSASDYFSWLLEPIINMKLHDKVSSESTEALMNMYKNFQISGETFWKGTGMWINNDGTYSAKVDAGILRNLYFGGIVYVIVLYVGIFVFITKIKNNMKLVGCVGNIFLFFLLGMLYVLFEYKGDISFSFIKIFLIFLLDIYSRRKTNSIVIKMKFGNGQ